MPTSRASGIATMSRMRYFQGRPQGGFIARVSAPDVETWSSQRLRGIKIQDEARRTTTSSRNASTKRSCIVTASKRCSKTITLRRRIRRRSTISIPFAPTLPLRKGVAHSPTGDKADGRGAARLTADRHRAVAELDRDDPQRPQLTSVRSPNGKSWPNATFGSWRRSPICRRASFRPSPKAARLLT